MFNRVPWFHLKAEIANTWQQGQHVLICAPTGRGKTVLTQQLLPMRSHVVFFGTKTRDEEYDVLRTQYGFTRLTNWPPRYGFQDKVMLWPTPKDTITATAAEQKRVFRHALDNIFRKGNWTVCFDELHWMTHDLGLYNEIASMHHQGRSSGLTLIDGFQRPAFVPVIVYSSASHVFVWGTNYRDDLKKLSSVAKLDELTTAQLREVMGGLGEHEFVYINVRGNKPPVISQVRR